MKRILIFLLFAGISNVLFSQSKPKIGRINADDWNIANLDSLKKVCDAVILSNIGLSRIDHISSKGWMLEYSYYVKVLILNNDGVDKFGNIDIVYNQNDDVSIKGYTYSKDKSNKITEQKFTTRDASFTEYTTFRDNLILHIPGLKKNSILEYEISIRTGNIANVRDWEFQKEDPVLLSEYTTIIPEFFDFKAFYQGSYPVNIDKGSGVSTINMTNYSETYSYEKSVYSTQNLPGVPDEDYTSIKSNSFTKYRFEIRGYRDFIGGYHALGTDYNNIIEGQLFDDSNFIQYKKNNAFLDEVLGSVSIEKSIDGANTILKLISRSIAWNKQTGWLSPYKTYRKLINDKNGSAADINNLLIGAYRRAGFTAYPVLLSTRKNGLVNPFVPLLSNFNYVICLVVIDGKYILVDATEPSAPFGMLPLRCINGKGLIVTDDAVEQWIDLRNYTKAETLTSSTIKINLENNSLDKTILRKRKGIDLINFATGLDSLKFVEEFADKYTSEFSGSEIKSHKIGIEGYEAIQEVEVSNPLLVANNAIYISPFEDFIYKKNPFNKEKRYQAIDFISPWKKIYMATIDVPEGYIVETELESKIFTTPDKKFVFKINSIQNGNKLSLIATVIIEESYFLPNQYPDIRLFFDTIERELSKQVMLVNEV
ncbi:DUF3857 domain-containing protein [Marinigracilibium pacificum]|uniref:DUF3857 domain-containing protein n=1 Tax=Marinigracilibium pacificum TaxID=2729599 RepID=A0A848IYI7_9BACT|nr:DUF3857 domain-containing protein [Marinigracilibium pacificum]NMM48391.1 DUF3857 domain-containing protein [Marinigracilibium pacificum]